MEFFSENTGMGSRSLLQGVVQTQDQTQVSHIAGGFFTSNAGDTGSILGWEDPLEKGWATHSSILGFPWWLSWKRICLKCWIPGFDSWVEKIPWRKERLLTPVFWPGEFHGLYSRGVTKSWRQLSNFCFLSIYLLDLAGLYICCWVSQMAPVLKTCLPMQET